MIIRHRAAKKSLNFGRRLRLLKWPFIGLVAISVLVCCVGWWQWSKSERKFIASQALEEERAYRVFNPNSDGPILYSLDGHMMRNSLFPAIIFSVNSFIRSQPLPKIIAIESTSSRDRDFRPSQGTPTYWRPTISGRAADFDRFIFNELIPEIEGNTQAENERYIMGHSLSGLYVMDLAGRDTTSFSGYFAFAPTFSHDLSIQERLQHSCRSGAIIYSNWGLESARDTEVFEETVSAWKSQPECRLHQPITPRHYGSIHATIMFTGHLHLAARSGL